MKAYLKYDPILQAIEFEVEGYLLTHHVNHITEIKEITAYEEGFLTMEVNYGEEYSDFVELLEVGVFTDSFKQEVLPLLEKLQLNEIELVRS